MNARCFLPTSTLLLRGGRVRERAWQHVVDVAATTSTSIGTGTGTGTVATTPAVVAASRNAWISSFPPRASWSLLSQRRRGLLSSSSSSASLSPCWFTTATTTTMTMEERFKELESEVVRLQKELAEQRLEIDQQRSNDVEQRLEIEQLRANDVQLRANDVRQQQELNGIKSAMSPAVFYALMETAVYEQVAQLPNDSNFVQGPMFNVEALQYSASSIGSLVLQTLLGGDSGKKSHGGIPQKGITDPTIKKERLKMVMQKTLVGLHKFVSAIAKDELAKLPPDRNMVVHNGDLVRRVHMTHTIKDPVLADSSFDDARVTEIYTEVQHRNQDETVLLAGDGEDELKLLVDSITAAIDQKLGQGYCALDDVAAAKQIVVFGL